MARTVTDVCVCELCKVSYDCASLDTASWTGCIASRIFLTSEVDVTGGLYASAALSPQWKMMGVCG